MQGQSLGRDGRVHDHFRLPLPHVIGIGLEHVARSLQGDGHNRHAGEDGDVETPTFEGKHAAGAAAMAFGKQEHGFSIANLLRHYFHAFQGLVRPVTIDGDVPRAPQVPSQERQVKQRALGDEAKLHGQIHEENGNIHGALVVRAIDGGGAGVDVLQSFHPYPDSAGLQNEPGPHAGTGMLPAALRVKERAEQGDGSADGRISVDQDIGEEQGTQVAEEIADAPARGVFCGAVGGGGLHGIVRLGRRGLRRKVRAVAGCLPAGLS